MVHRDMTLDWVYDRDGLPRYKPLVWCPRCREYTLHLAVLENLVDPSLWCYSGRCGRCGMSVFVRQYYSNKPHVSLSMRGKEMAHKWSDLYSKLPSKRRAVIQARVEGEVARRNGEPYDVNPYLFSDQDSILHNAWRDGYYDADEAVLTERMK